MDAITQKVLNDFCKTQIALQLPGKPAATSGIQLGDLIADAANDLATPASHVAVLGALATVGTAGITLIGALTPVGVGAVDVACALATDVDTELGILQAKIDAVTPSIASITNINARITTLQAKIDSIITALTTAGIML